MDFATLIGLVGAMMLIASAVILGVSPDVFLNGPSLLIVIGGSLLVVLAKFSVLQFLGAFTAAIRAFKFKLPETRAASVANALLTSGTVEPNRLAVKGLADTASRVDNDSAENRAKNRRVEIIIDLSDPLEEQEIQLRDIIDGQLPGQDAVIDMQSGPVSVESITW